MTCRKSKEIAPEPRGSCAHCDEVIGGCPVVGLLVFAEQGDDCEDDGSGWGAGAYLARLEACDTIGSGTGDDFDAFPIPVLPAPQGCTGNGKQGHYGNGGSGWDNEGAGGGNGDDYDVAPDLREFALAADLAQLPEALRVACLDRLDDDARAVAQDYARAHGLRTLAAVGVPRG